MKYLILLILAAIGTAFYYVHQTQQEQLAAIKAKAIEQTLAMAPPNRLIPIATPTPSPVRAETEETPVVQNAKELLAVIKNRCLSANHPKDGEVILTPKQNIVFTCCPFYPAVAQKQIANSNGITQYRCEPQMGTLIASDEYGPKGQLHGVWKHYSSLGLLLTQDTFVKGINEGMSKKYYDIVLTDKGELIAGQLYAEIPHVKGVKNGISKYYYPNGKIFAKANFTHGKLRKGKMEYFAPDGSSLSEKAAWKLNPSMPQPPEISPN